MNKAIFIGIAIICFSLAANAQLAPSKVSILPEDRLFEPLIFDPNEAQAFGSIVGYWENESYTDMVFLPFSLGFYKGFLRKNTPQPWEISFDFSALTQFLWTFDDGKSERNFHNIDFKVSMMLHKKVNERHSFRLRFYHVSSHLGDDYILRNGIHSYFPNPNNYEQLDFFWAIQDRNIRYYSGAGMVVRPETIRKRFSFQCGLELDSPVKEGGLMAPTGGFNLKLLEENNFNPGLKAGLGVKIGQSAKPLRVIAEFYRGNMPYGPYEFTRVQWLGVGLYFMP